jgi:hypothetical protein
MYHVQELEEGLKRFDAARFGEWVKYSSVLGQFDSLMVSQFQGLGRIDAQILRAVENLKLGKSPLPFFDEMELNTISYLWILGVYEIVRTLTQKADPIRSTTALFEKELETLKKMRNRLELVRMPLAKFDIADKADKTKFDLPFAYPAWHNEKGVSWKIGANEFIAQNDISDDFMAIIKEISNQYAN